MNSGRCAPVALEGRRAAGRGEGRPRDHRRALQPHPRALREGGRDVPRPDPEAHLAVRDRRRSPSPEELAREYNGKALADVTDPKDTTKVLVKKGDQLTTLRPAARRRHDRVRLLDLLAAATPTRTTWPAATTSDPSGLGAHAGLGVVVAGEPARPLQRAPPAIRAGKPWDPRRALVRWNGERVGRARRPGHTSRTCRPRRAWRRSS